MAGHPKCILLSVLSILLSRHPYASNAWNQHVLIGRSRAVPRSAETQARAYAISCRPEYLLVWDQTKGKEKRKRKRKRSGNAAAVSHGHLKPSNIDPLCVSHIALEAFLHGSFLDSMRCCRFHFFRGIEDENEVRGVQYHPHAAKYWYGHPSCGTFQPMLASADV